MLTFKKTAVLGLSERVPVIAGGGDTQLAIKSADATFFCMAIQPCIL
jgi:autoinducer 2 (AI-2) kinase